MSDEELALAMAELQEVVRCRCDEAYRDRGLKDPHCECDSAEAVKVVAIRIKALTAKLEKAEAGLLAIAKRDEQMIWGEDYEVEEAFKDMRDISCATLAEISSHNKGESHE